MICATLVNTQTHRQLFNRISAANESETVVQLNLDASGADGKEAVSLERIADGNVAIHSDQYGQPYCRTFRHVAEWIHVLYTNDNALEQLDQLSTQAR